MVFQFIFALTVVVYVVAAYLYSKKKCPAPKIYRADLRGKVAVITGSSAGIGKETARKLAAKGATVIFACRDEKKTLAIISQIKQSTNNENLHYIELNLSDYASVRRFAQLFKASHKTCDILINNAGLCLPTIRFNSEGHELTFATNHLGHFLLTYQLLDCLSTEGRVINVSSGAHHYVKATPSFEKMIKGEYGALMQAYSRSKFANILFTLELQEHFQKTKRPLKAVSVHPGFVRSEIYHSKNGAKYLSYIVQVIIDVFLRPFSLSEEQGARTSEHCALIDFKELEGGAYYEKSAVSKMSRLVLECGLQRKWWELSKAAVRVD